MRPNNLLLATLPRDTVDRWQRHMRTVDLTHGQVLRLADQTITDVYFSLDCMISITITTFEGRTAEAGAVGCRGMVGINAFMGGLESSHTEYVAQIAGTAVIMPVAPLLAEFDQSKAVREVLLRYTQAYIAHLSQNVACNRLHRIEQRLARWIMECRDRLRSDDVAITHEFLGEMLGVRRAGVSETTAKLEAQGLIKTSRKRVHIVNAQALEAASCECYRVLRDEYDRLLGPMFPGGAGTTN